MRGDVFEDAAVEFDGAEEEENAQHHRDRHHRVRRESLHIGDLLGRRLLAARPASSEQVNTGETV